MTLDRKYEMTDCFQFLPRNTAIARMNKLAAAGTPFVFVIDYNGNHSIVMPETEINPSQILFCFSEHGNWNETSPNCDEKVEWNITPPSKEEYKRSFNLVRQNLLAGNTYLVNLTCRVPINTNLTLRDIFFRSKARYKLWLKNQFVCFSPEIFVRIDGRKIFSYPMKGTVQDVQGAESSILSDIKEAAEHATIVDLIRNDLSMEASKVKVKRYRYIERLVTNKGSILQTSSEIEGLLPTDWRKRVGNILFSLLPAGSITGAPKPQTIEIINEAEGYQRGFYTGVMGRYDNGKLDSAVMIRFIDSEDGKFFFKAGGGITAKSNWEKEYEEIIQKIYVPIY